MKKNYGFWEEINKYFIFTKGSPIKFLYGLGFKLWKNTPCDMGYKNSQL